MASRKEERANKRTQIVTVHEADGDWREKARQLNVPTGTAYRWVKEGDKPDMRGGRRHSKVTADHRKHMVAMVEGNPRITLSGIVSGIQEKFGLSLSKPTISKHLDAMMYTLKNVRFEPERANTIGNKEKRRAFVESLLNYQGLNLPLIYMDETNFNLHISRTEGRSRRGTRCTTVAAGSKGANIHVIGCISNLGLLHSQVKRGSFKKVDAIEWITACLGKAMIKHGGPVVLVLDNAPCHSGVESEVLQNEFASCTILRLSPYSPMFNPIENIWALVKSEVKKDLAVRMKTIMGLPPNNLSVREHRTRELEAVVGDALQVITPTVCSSCIAGIQAKVSDALNLCDMVF